MLLDPETREIWIHELTKERLMADDELNYDSDYIEVTNGDNYSKLYDEDYSEEFDDQPRYYSFYDIVEVAEEAEERSTQTDR